jgi:hypothetical protein
MTLDAELLRQLERLKESLIRYSRAREAKYGRAQCAWAGRDTLVAEPLPTKTEYQKNARLAYFGPPGHA